MALILNGDTGITYPVATATGSATQASAGRVLQVVSSVYSISTSTTSATPVSTGITASITPSSSSNKVLVMVDTQIYGGTAANGVAILIYRNSTLIKTPAADGGPKYYTTYNYTANLWSAAAMIYLDSPSTTSSTTYTVYFASYNSGTSVVVGGGGSPVYASTITLQEISA